MHRSESMPSRRFTSPTIHGSWRRAIGAAAWLLGAVAGAGAPPLRVGFDAVLEPIAYVDDQGRPAGFAADYVRAVAQAGGLEVEFVTGRKEQLQAEFRDGRIAVIAAIAFTEARAKVMDFTLPYLMLKGAVFRRKGGVAIDSVADFSGRRIAVSRGNFTHDYLLAHPEWGAQIEPVDSTEAALQAVQSGICDAAVNVDLVAQKLVRERRLDQVERTGIELPGLAYKYHLAVHQGDAALVRQINEAQLAVHERGEYAEIYERWIGPLHAPGATWRPLRPLAVPAVLLLIVVVVTFAAQRRLNRELERRVDERTAELAGRVAEVERLNHELEAFSYSVSHDLRAPLRNITGFLELLTRRTGGRLDAEGERFVATVTSEAKRMAKLIDDLLAFSRIGRAKLAMQRVALAAVVAEVRTELQPEIGARRIEWKLAELPAVRGDPALLRQVMANLLGNAVKFTRRRECAVIEIGVNRANANDPTGAFFVRDNGAGFNPKYAARLFGVFQRLHNQADFEGTGIGLANVQRIITAHGGRVWAESETDHGATIHFTLPVLPP